MKRTKEALDNLKQVWEADPCFDIEDTAGFEEHREELAAYRQKKEAEWAEARRLQDRQKIVRLFNMRLHDGVLIANDGSSANQTWAVRVPGGWIYRASTFDDRDRKIHVSQVFVPYPQAYHKGGEPITAADLHCALSSLVVAVEAFEGRTTSGEILDTLKPYKAMLAACREAGELLQRIEEGK